LGKFSLTGYPIQISEQSHLENNNWIYRRGTGMTVVGTDVDERKVDDTGNLPEKVVLGDAFFK